MDAQIDLDEGKIAIIIDDSSDFKWKISHQDVGGLSSYSFETKIDHSKKGFSIGGGKLNEPVEIMPQQEIVLNTYLFDKGQKLIMYDNQYYVDNKEALKQYNYAYLIKCQFSK